MAVETLTVQSANTTPSSLDFWHARLAGELPESHFSPDRPRSLWTVPRYCELSLILDGGTGLKLAKATSGAADQLFVVLASSVVALLAKYSRGDEVILGTPALTDLSHEIQRINAPLALRVPLDRDLSFELLKREVESVSSDAFAHQMGSVDALFTVLGLQPGQNRCPLFDTVIRFDGYNEPLDLNAYPVDVLFDFSDTDGTISGTVKYREDLYDGDRFEQLVVHFANVLKAVLADGNILIKDLKILTSQEHDKLVVSLNDNRVSFQTDRTIHELVEAQVKRIPDATAVAFRDESLTYRDLNERANRLARMLIEAGVGKGEFVAILQHRNCDFLTAMLAVFKAGAAYVPVDPTYPEDRIQYMLSDCQAKTVITEADIVAGNGELLSPCDALETVICQDAQMNADALAGAGSALSIFGPDDLAALPGSDLDLNVTCRDRAYMIYTSGSTGRPKGAICRHDGAMNHLFGELHGLGISDEFSFLQSAASSSDISVWQFLAPVIYGGTTVVVDHETVTDPEQLFEVIKSKDLSLVELVPVVLRTLVDYLADVPVAERALPALCWMMATGDALPVDLVNRWFALYPDIPIANTYGPTEASDDITLFMTDKPLAADRTIVPIGPPMPNLNIFILDPSLDLVPFGVPGEICVSGIGVGEGYWNRPDKTAAAFVPNPVPGAPGETIYRTGDLGRWLKDGSIEFLGRIDQQVKIRGFRIEPGEVQTAILGHAAVNEAVIITKPDAVGDNRLVAYYVTEAGQSVSSRDLRAFLLELLADYMVPAVFVAIDKLPLTPIGKIDLKALPDVPQYEFERLGTYVPPSTETEKALERIWSELLGISEIGIHDDFVELGGDSILSINVAARAKIEGIFIRPAELFVRPTINHLAKAWDERAEDDGGLDSADHVDGTGKAPFVLANLEEGVLAKLKSRFPGAEDAYLLSPTQTGIYLQSLLLGRHSGVYIEQILFTLNGEFHLRAFEDGWKAVIERFSVLRTAINRRGTPQPIQVILDTVPFEVDFHDWLGKNEGVIEVEFDALVKAERVRGFDLSQAPLMRVTVVRTHDDRHRVLWTYHHIILDGWSEPVVIENAFKAYGSIRDGSAPALADPPPYRHFIEWLSQDDQSPGHRFWQSELQGFRTPSTIPFSDPAPVDNGNLSHGWIETTLSPDDTKRCHATAQRLRLTPSTLVQGAWALLLARYSGCRDVIYGSAVSGRQIDLDRVEDTPGIFIATLPVRISVDDTRPLGEWFQTLQRKTVEIRQYEHFSPAAMQEMTDVPPECLPVFNTIVVMANYPGSDLARDLSEIVEMTDVEYITMPHYAMTVFVIPEERMKLRIVFERGRYTADRMMNVLEVYREAVIRAVRDPDQRIETFLAGMRTR